MKRFFSVIALMLMVVIATPDAEAKKFGGGKSFGKSYKTAPVNKSNTTNTGAINKQNTGKQATPTSGTKKGMMGGLFGGLLAGGLLAALFAGGAFEGFQFFDIILIAAIVFMIFKVIQKTRRNKQRPAYASGSFGNAQPSQTYQRQQPQQAGGFSSSAGFGSVQSDVPFNYPPNFDMPAFLHGAREHYRILQQAWNQNELAKIQEYVTPEMYNDLVRERATLIGEQHTEVLYVDVAVVRADHNQTKAELSLKFSGRYRDQKEGVEEDIKDIWHLERSLTQANAPWLIVGIEG